MHITDGSVPHIDAGSFPGQLRFPRGGFRGEVSVGRFPWQ